MYKESAQKIGVIQTHFDRLDLVYAIKINPDGILPGRAFLSDHK